MVNSLRRLLKSAQRRYGCSGSTLRKELTNVGCCKSRDLTRGGEPELACEATFSGSRARTPDVDIIPRTRFRDMKQRSINVYCLALLVALCIVRLWAIPLRSSFWVDEMATSFVVHRGDDDCAVADLADCG